MVWPHLLHEQPSPVIMLLMQQHPTNWRIKCDAPKNTWIKQIEDNLKQQHLTLEQAKVKARDHIAWKYIIDQDWNPKAPTAMYWLHGQPPLPTASSGQKKIFLWVLCVTFRKNQISEILKCQCSTIKIDGPKKNSIDCFPVLCHN